MSDPAIVERAEPDEMFALLADDTRLAIINALWEVEEHTASFSTLREHVGLRDSGKFNYHLDRLVDAFVVKTPEGYRLTEAGHRVIGTIEAGAYTAEADIEPLELEEPCATCGGELTLTYDRDIVEVTCGSCGFISEFGVPPNVFAGVAREDIPTVASQYLRTKFQHIANGFCAYCDGATDPSLESIGDLFSGDEQFEEDIEDAPIGQYVCSRCGMTATATLSLALHGHPAVVAFHHERGYDVSDQPVWSLTGIDPETQYFLETEPPTATVRFHVDEDHLDLTVDETLTAIDIEQK